MLARTSISVNMASALGSRLQSVPMNAVRRPLFVRNAQIPSCPSVSPREAAALPGKASGAVEGSGSEKGASLMSSQCLVKFPSHAVAQASRCQHLDVGHPREHPADEFLVPGGFEPHLQ